MKDTQFMKNFNNNWRKLKITLEKLKQLYEKLDLFVNFQSSRKILTLGNCKLAVEPVEVCPISQKGLRASN